MFKLTLHKPVSAYTRSIDEYVLAEFSPILAQAHVVVLAEFAALVDDCTHVDPNHPRNVLLGSKLDT